MRVLPSYRRIKPAGNRGLLNLIVVDLNQEIQNCFEDTIGQIDIWEAASIFNTSRSGPNPISATDKQIHFKKKLRQKCCLKKHRRAVFCSEVLAILNSVFLLQVDIAQCLRHNSAHFISHCSSSNSFRNTRIRFLICRFDGDDVSDDKIKWLVWYGWRATASLPNQQELLFLNPRQRQTMQRATMSVTPTLRQRFVPDGVWNKVRPKYRPSPLFWLYLS